MAGRVVTVRLDASRKFRFRSRSDWRALMPHGFDMQFESRPTAESVTAGDRMLSVSKSPLRVAASKETQNVFRLFLQVVKIGAGW